MVSIIKLLVALCYTMVIHGLPNFTIVQHGTFTYRSLCVFISDPAVQGKLKFWKIHRPKIKQI